MQNGADSVIKSLHKLRVGIIFDEYHLQAEIAATLSASGIKFEKEYFLGAGSRADFFTDEGVVIEVKKGKPNRVRLLEQINKYSKYKEVEAVIIVVETSLKIPIEETENGKPCCVFGLRKLWGIAL